MGIKQTGERIRAIRFRTWVITAVQVIALVLLLFVALGWKEFSLIDFILLSVIQIITHLSYFPDGESFGSKDPLLVKNRVSYNDKANEINKNRETKLLREYCEVEFEERKKRYIQNECGAIGITIDEYGYLKNKTKAEIKKLKSVEYDGRLVFLTKPRRHRLIKLLFKKLPIEKNNVETVMSAVENDGFRSIHDNSTRYKVVNYLMKFTKVIAWGGFLAFIGYSARDGITIETIVRMVMYLSSMIITAITSFSAGEIGQKTYKNQFYVDLCNFIDGFNEWKTLDKPEKKC